VQWFSRRELLPRDDTSFVHWKLPTMRRVKLYRLFQGQEHYKAIKFTKIHYKRKQHIRCGKVAPLYCVLKHIRMLEDESQLIGLKVTRK
jgi:hypothetical protein